jgi:hypothetical protein
MISIGEPPHTAALLHAGHDSLRGTRTAPEPAHGRAPARDEPAVAGVPWAVESGENVWGHVIEITRS